MTVRSPTVSRFRDIAATIMAQTSEVYDLLIVVDATYSMTHTLESLRTSLPQILNISTLTAAFSRIGLLAYRDYCDKALIEWSEWLDLDSTSEAAPNPNLQRLAKSLEPLGGGDYPEAAKTALAKAYDLMRPEAKTILILYTDAPPHTDSPDSDYYKKEQKALKTLDVYGSTGPAFADWASAARTLRQRAQVFTMLTPGMRAKDTGYYAYLSEMTKGTCFRFSLNSASVISQVTIDVLLAWMGVGKADVADTKVLLAVRIKSALDLGQLKIEDETDLKGSKYFSTHNFDDVKLTQRDLEDNLPKRATPLGDFSKQYISSESYRQLVVEKLKEIIEDDVTAITFNPVFGSLWRTVCNDRGNPAREGLIATFGASIEKMTVVESKTRMKEWLAESYDFTAEIKDLISKVPADQRFPCVYLDPTLKFEQPGVAADTAPITAFTREDLLEIGRSCDGRILRRLGKVLTQLSFANTPEQLPAHIANADAVLTIPLALSSKDHNRKFWKVLLHLVVSGTMLSARPAAVLAALCIRLGIEPLLPAAYAEALNWKDKWNDIGVPETWNSSCLSLLLDADKVYTDRQSNAAGENDTATCLLEPHDRQLFQCLVDYKMLEMNMGTTLVAKVNWRPQKASLPLGQTVVCRSCKFARSITMMARDNVCGFCALNDYNSQADRTKRINACVSRDDCSTTPRVWVECSMVTCMGRYVLYNPDELRVRPKCFYCRSSEGPAPAVKCVRCVSKVICPEEYQSTLDVSLEEFLCVACVSGRETTVDEDTTATQLVRENGSAWVLKNDNGQIKTQFSKRSVFTVVSDAANLHTFSDDVQVFPPTQALALSLNGRTVHNPADVAQQLKSWVNRRQTEQGVCSLCFDSFSKDRVQPACGRSGCQQRICHDCLTGWYGLNAAGRIINTAALNCPFCRRRPAPKTLARYGMGVHAVGDLRVAVEQAGEWIFAWCIGCGCAKPFTERVCARGAPPELTHWRCPACVVLMMAVEGGPVVKSARECPACTVMTEKTDGCNHISCPCGAHWCYFCGFEKDEEGIYSHMEEEHGGYYGDYEDDDDDGV